MKNIGALEEKYLTKNASNFELIPLLNLLNGNLRIQEKSIIFRMSFSFTNNSNIINNLEIDESNNRIVITINYYNFFGQKGILPDYLLEDTIHEKNKSFNEFFNIFFHRFFEIYIQIIKNRFVLQSYPIFSKIFRLFNLRAQGNQFFYKFQHLILADFESATTLKILLQNYLKLNVKIISHTGKFKDVHEKDQACLRTACHLGENSILGKKLKCPSSKIDIIVDLEDSNKLNSVLEILKSSEFNEIINIYINKKVDYELFLSLYPKISRKLSYKNNILYLGKNSFIKSDDKNCKKILLKIF